VNFDVPDAEGPKRFFSSYTPERLAHGYLFTGPKGSEKGTFALRLAQSLLCLAPKTTLLGYDGECTGCKMVQSGTHPDLFVMRGQLKIGDADAAQGFHESEELTARDLVRQFSLHAYEDGWRIFIFEDAEFTNEAANALLAFFEDPPNRVLLLLTTDAPGALIETIRSRLIEVRFPAIARPIELDEAARNWFYNVLEDGAVDDSGWANRDSLEEGLETIKTLTRDWLVQRVAGKKVAPLASEDARAIAKLPKAEPADLMRVLSAIEDAERIARTNVTPHLVAEYVRMALSTCSH